MFCFVCVRFCVAPLGKLCCINCILTLTLHVKVVFKKLSWQRCLLTLHIMHTLHLNAFKPSNYFTFSMGDISVMTTAITHTSTPSKKMDINYDLNDVRFIPRPQRYIFIWNASFPTRLNFTIKRWLENEVCFKQFENASIGVSKAKSYIVFWSLCKFDSQIMSTYIVMYNLAALDKINVKYSISIVMLQKL